MTLTDILQRLPDEIGRYALTITRFYNPEEEETMWSFTYENYELGTILEDCDINTIDFEDGARNLFDWLCRHGHINL